MYFLIEREFRTLVHYLIVLKQFWMSVVFLSLLLSLLKCEFIYMEKGGEETWWGNLLQSSWEMSQVRGLLCSSCKRMYLYAPVPVIRDLQSFIWVYFVTSVSKSKWGMRVSVLEVTSIIPLIMITKVRLQLVCHIQHFSAMCCYVINFKNSPTAICWHAYNRQNFFLHSCHRWSCVTVVAVKWQWITECSMWCLLLFVTSNSNFLKNRT